MGTTLHILMRFLYIRGSSLGRGILNYAVTSSYVLGFTLSIFSLTSVKSSSKTGIIIGAAVSSSVLVLLLLCVGVYALQQRRRVTRALAHNTSGEISK